MTTLKKFVVPAVIVALVVAAALTLFRGDDRKTLTAHFPRTISIYEGSDVRVLGVPVGTGRHGDAVRHRRGRHDVATTPRSKIPADAKAVIIAPSIVGDRFVQLTPASPRATSVLRRRRGRSTRTAPRCRSSSTRSTPASTT